jgi:hypothetical protein
MDVPTANETSMVRCDRDLKRASRAR